MGGFPDQIRSCEEEVRFQSVSLKEVQETRGDFSGWSKEKCSALYWELAHLTSDAFIEGVAFRLDNAEYETDYKAGEKPKKVRLDSKYGLCFRECLLFFVRQGLKRMRRRKFPKLFIVLESGHQNTGDAVRIFNEVKADLNAHGCDMLQSITFADKDDCDPLMMADFIAHGAYLLELEDRSLPSRPQRGFHPIRRKESGVTHLMYDPGALSQIKAELIAKKPRRAGSSVAQAS